MDWSFGWSGVGPGEWGYGAADLLAWSLLGASLVVVPVLVLVSRARRRRRFWCVELDQEVEAEFEESGLPGLRESLLRSCSVFDPATAITCRRRCLDHGQRRLWSRTAAWDQSRRSPGSGRLPRSIPRP